MKRQDKTGYVPQQATHVEASLENFTFQVDWDPLPKSLSNWTGFLLFHVTELAGQMYAQALASIRLQPFQVGVLQLLASEGPMVQARLGEFLSTDKATMVGLLNDLETQGLVERRPNPHDKRSYHVHLLDGGRARLAEAEKVNAFANKMFFADLTPDEQTTLHQLLERLATRRRFE